MRPKGFEIARFSATGYSSDPEHVTTALEEVVLDVAAKIRAFRSDEEVEDDDGETSLQALAAKAAAATCATDEQLKKHVGIVRSAFRRLDVAPSVFDIDGFLLGGTDGLIDSSSGTPRFRPYRLDDLVSLSVGYDVSALEQERATPTFVQLRYELERLLPVPAIREELLLGAHRSKGSGSPPVPDAAAWG